MKYGTNTLILKERKSLFSLTHFKYFFKIDTCSLFGLCHAMIVDVDNDVFFKAILSE